MQLFRKDIGSFIGVALFAASFIAAIPLGYKAAQLADIYAVPFFSGLIAYTIMAITCELAHVQDKMFIREVLEFVGFMFGIYVGQSLQKKVKLVVTSMLGSTLLMFGVFMALDRFPIEKRDALTQGVYIGANLVMFVITYFY